MKLIALASLLPNWLIKKLECRFDTPGKFTCDVEEGSSFWGDAGYWKYVRCDKRKEWFWHKVRGYRY